MLEQLIIQGVTVINVDFNENVKWGFKRQERQEEEKCDL